MNENKIVKIHCIDCGSVFTAKTRKALRCEKCKKEEIYRKQKEYHLKERLKREAAKRPKPKASLNDILKELKQYNEDHGTHLSYGQYTVMLSNAEHCVCCGAIIPEGRQVCRRCELKQRG